MSLAALQLRRYREREYPLPTEGLFQATIRVRQLVGPGLRHMAKLGIDLDGRWFELYHGSPRVIEREDVLPETVRVVDWTKAPEVKQYKFLHG